MCCEDPAYDTHFCASCGECLETVPEVCDNCGLCLDCCLLEAENLGCTCGEYCFEDVNDEHVCVNCGLCFGVIESCPDCGLCVDCCEEVSLIEGCDCDHPVCVEGDEWDAHFREHHAQFAGSHSARPATSWSFDDTYHWKDCRYCDEADHITSKAAHSLRNGRCTVCGFSDTEPIIISKQPQDRSAKVSNYRAEGDDPLKSSNNRVRFSVTAFGKDLRYTWFGYGSANPARFEEIRVSSGGVTNIDYNDTADQKSLIVNITDDDCQNEHYYYRCYVSDGANGMWSDIAELSIDHCYTLESEKSPVKEGHYMQCHGDGCSELRLVPHVYTHWEWADSKHTVRTQTCDVCGYTTEVVIHDHAKWVRTFFLGEALFEDENHRYEFDPGTEPGNWYQTGNMNAEFGEPGFKMACEDTYGNIWTADWDYHTGWCYCDDCMSNPVKIRELHHFGPWQGSDDPQAGIIYRVCGDCSYTQYATDEQGRPTQWTNGMHPVIYIDCSGPNKFVRAGDELWFTPDKIPGKVFAGISIEYYILKNDGKYYKASPVNLPAGTVYPGETYRDYWQVPDNKEFPGSGRIEVRQLFSDDVCAHEATEIVGQIQAPCGRRGYTGDTVCAYCGQLIEQGEPTEYRSHGALITVTEDIYKTDSSGEIMLDRSGNPSLIARGPHDPDCATQTNGNEADKICSVCGYRAERGRSIPWKEGHSFNSWTANVPCTDPLHPVTNRMRCSHCGEYSYLPEDLSDVDADFIEYFQEWHYHAQLINEVRPTCTAYGYSGDVYCPDCGKTLAFGTKTKPAGHTWDEGVVVTSPTGNSQRKVYTCTVCGAVKTEIYGDMLLGDVNLDKTVDAKDLTALARHVAKIQTFTDDREKMANADVNRDGAVDAKDLTRLARFVAKIIPSL